MAESKAILNKVVFKVKRGSFNFFLWSEGTKHFTWQDAATAPFLKKYASLFPGLGFAAGYKVAQRVYKFGGQPFVKDYLNNNHKDLFVNAFGEKTGKTIMHATAGRLVKTELSKVTMDILLTGISQISLVGIGEIALLPLDVLKIKRQTNPEAFRGRGFFTIIKDEGMGLYR